MSKVNRKKRFLSVASGRSELFRESKIIRRPTRFFFDFGSGRISRACQKLQPSKIFGFCVFLFPARKRRRQLWRLYPTSTSSSFLPGLPAEKAFETLKGCNFAPGGPIFKIFFSLISSRRALSNEMGHEARARF